jgi:hypothetical protein
MEDRKYRSYTESSNWKTWNIREMGRIINGSWGEVLFITTTPLNRQS